MVQSRAALDKLLRVRFRRLEISHNKMNFIGVPAWRNCQTPTVVLVVLQQICRLKCPGHRHLCALVNWGPQNKSTYGVSLPQDTRANHPASLGSKNSGHPILSPAVSASVT